jgi:hypothetical protein
VAAGRSSPAQRVLTALSWAAGAYLVSLLAGYYLNFWGVKRHHIESASFVFIALLLAQVITRSGADYENTIARGRLSLLLAIVGLAVFGACIYWPVIHAGLFADDYVLLEAAREGRYTVWTQLFRPVVFVLWRRLDRLTTDVGYVLHAFNLACHVLNGVMVTVLARWLGLSDRGSIVAGLLFVCSPASVEAVAWPSGIQDVLMTTFVLGFLLTTMQSTVASGSIVAGVVLLAALFTKETAVVAPAVGAVLVVASPAERRNWTHLAVSAAIVGAFLLIRFTLLPLPADYAGTFDRYHAKEVLVRPFASLSVPLRELETAQFPLAALALTAIIVLMLCRSASQWARHDRRFHLVLALTVCVLVSIAPVHAYFSVTADLFGSRYLYLGSVAWSVMLVTLAQGRSRTATSAFLSIVLALWTVFSYRHATVWREAAAMRDRVVGLAQQIPVGTCVAWAVYDLPAIIDGVPVFVNGFPEAMRAAGRAERFHVTPDTLEPGECRIRWNGSALEVDN